MNEESNKPDFSERDTVITRPVPYDTDSIEFQNKFGELKVEHGVLDGMSKDLADSEKEYKAIKDEHKKQEEKVRGLSYEIAHGISKEIDVTEKIFWNEGIVRIYNEYGKEIDTREIRDEDHQAGLWDR